VDDVLAMLLAFTAKPEILEVMMISVTYGNVEVEKLVTDLLIKRVSLTFVV
jgi:inosine-uridine nucleoside N-ribohydrolase